MSEEEGGDDKPYEATQRKLDEARKKGEFARSADLTTAATYGGMLLALTIFGAASVDRIGTALARALGSATADAAAIYGPTHSAGFGAGLTGPLRALLPPLLPILLLPAAAAILAIVVQRGFVLAPSRLEPKLSRLSPLAGLRNKFGRAGLFEFGKSTAKMSVYAAILFAILWGDMPRLLGALTLSPGQVAAEFGRVMTRLLFVVAIVAGVVGALDFLWQRAEHQRKNRMSHKELRDEMKHSDGDPLVKQQRRERGATIALNQMMAAVPKADVVIVNPTHYAVALKWDRRRGTAPVCVAKGVDEVALRIRVLAMEAGVPIHADPPTARLLWSAVEIGDAVPPDHYRAVAAAIRFADRLRRTARR